MNRKWLIPFSLFTFTFSLLFLACPKNNDTPRSTRVYGQVRDTQGRPVQGATVVIHLGARPPEDPEFYRAGGGPLIYFKDQADTVYPAGFFARPATGTIADFRPSQPFAGNPESLFTQVLWPQNGSFSSCETVSIGIYATSPAGIDTFSLILEVAGVRLGWGDPSITFRRDTIRFTRYYPELYDGSVVQATIINLADFAGNGLVAPLGWSWTMDLAGPRVLSSNPPAGGYLDPSNVVISWALTDRSGVDYAAHASNMLKVNGHQVDPSALAWDAIGSRLIFTPLLAGLHYSAGDTLGCCLKLYDLAGVCGANVRDTCMDFIVQPLFDCREYGNPFTPNGDGVRDVAYFQYPGMDSLTAKLVITDSDGGDVNTVWFDPSTDPWAHWWNGRDIWSRAATGLLTLTLTDSTTGGLICTFEAKTYEQVVVTNASGNYEYVDFFPGDWYVTAAAAGYRRGTIPVYLTAGEDHLADLVLQPE